MNVHSGGHPDQGHVHGVRHHWSDNSGSHTTTFWFESDQEARDSFDRVAAECCATEKHDRVALVIDGVEVES